MTGFKNTSKYLQNAPKSFSPFLTLLRFFFKDLALVTFVRFWCTNFANNFRKNEEQSPRYSKTDRPVDQIDY